MKPDTFKAIGLALLLSSSLSLAPAVMADADEAAEQITIPDNAAGILKAIDAKSAELKATIDSGKLDDVHHQAFAIRDLVAALPAKSASLPADQLARLKGNVKFVATLADRLDASGDANDLAGTKSNYAKLVKVLASIHGNFTATK